MKRLLPIFILFSIFVSAQKQPATLHFNDGESIEGYGSIKGLNKIKFKISEDDEPSIWTGVIVKGITFHGFEFDVKFEYVKTIKNKDQLNLLEVLAVGEVTLYANITTDTSFFPNVSGGLPGVNTVKSSNITYYVKRKGEERATVLRGNFKKAIFTYFGDCIGLEKRVKNHEFRWATIVDLVNYYNDFCAF